MESPIHTAERVTAEVLPKLYAHIGRVCAYELQHEFGVEPEHVSRVLSNAGRAGVAKRSVGPRASISSTEFTGVLS